MLQWFEITAKITLRKQFGKNESTLIEELSIKEGGILDMGRPRIG